MQSQWFAVTAESGNTNRSLRPILQVSSRQDLQPIPINLQFGARHAKYSIKEIMYVDSTVHFKDFVIRNGLQHAVRYASANSTVSWYTIDAILKGMGRADQKMLFKIDFCVFVLFSFITH